MFHFILLTVLWTIIFEPCCVESTENGIAINKTDLTKILGGKEVLIKKYPFAVSVQLHYDENGENKAFHYCGGSLVRADWVITVAQCFLYYDEGHSTKEGYRVRDPDRYSVVAGLKNVRWIPVDDSHRIAVLSIHVSKYYDPPSHTEDIALMRLVSEFPMTKNIQLAHLPDLTYYDTFKPTSCSALGWGSTSMSKRKKRDAGIPDENMAESKVLSDYRSGDTERNLRFTVVKIVPHEQCKYMYGPFWTRTHISKMFQICAEALNNNRGSYGDAGGPLICNGLLVGTLSLIDAAIEAEKLEPTVYTKIDFYLDWINYTISTADALQTSRGSWWRNYAMVLALAVALKQI